MIYFTGLKMYFRFLCSILVQTKIRQNFNLTIHPQVLTTATSNSTTYKHSVLGSANWRTCTEMRTRTGRTRNLGASATLGSCSLLTVQAMRQVQVVHQGPPSSMMPYRLTAFDLKRYLRCQ